ncbi:MAG: hypothetical protein VXW58_00430 [Pseudomonadota bacterium]|nr:hypothetical protein [Pseudomonadota bacterium]
MSDAGPPGAMQRKALFLERDSYRRRRLMDAARVLPVLGAALFLLPVLWPDADTASAAPVRTSNAVIFIFGTWLVLIALAFCLGRAAPDWLDASAQDDTPDKG